MAETPKTPWPHWFPDDYEPDPELAEAFAPQPPDGD